MAKKKESKRTLIVDIGTASIAAGYLSAGETGVPLLSNVERVAVGSGTDTSREALLAQVGEALTTLLNKFSKEPPTVVHIVLAAPWHNARTRTITSKTDKPVSITQKTIEKAITQYKNEKPPESGNVDVEAVATMVAINGYATSVHKPVCGSTLRINLYESEVPESIETKVRSVIEKTFPHSTHTYNTFPLVAVVALRELMYATGFVVVDFSGEVTEVAFVYDNSIHHLATFPIGYYTIARGLSTNKGTGGVGDALSRLALFGRGELNEEEATVVRTSIKEGLQQWHKAFAESISEVSEQVPLPRKMFVISDKDPQQWLVKELKESNEHSFVVEPVTAPTVQNSLELGDAGVYDVFLSLAAIFFHIGKNSVVGEV